MKKVLFVSLVILTASVMVSCNKTEDPAPAKTNSEKLVGKNWKLTSATVILL